MVRHRPSPADQALLDYVHGKGLHLSSAQLERWRQIGALPTHHRSYPGRGTGSSSSVDDSAFDIAEALARASRQGRSAYEAVLQVFAVAPQHLGDLLEQALPIPERGVRAALDWFIDKGDQSLDRRIERTIRQRASSADDAFAIAHRIASKHYRAVRSNPPEASQYRSPFWEIPNADLDAEAARHALKFVDDGPQGVDITVDMIVDAFRRSDRSIEELNKLEDNVRSTLIHQELSGKPIPGIRPLLNMAETKNRLSDVSITEIRETRDKVGAVAEMSMLHMRLYGQKVSESLSARMIDASTRSIDANFIFHMILPIAFTPGIIDWRRMAVAIVMILTEPEEGYREVLDNLAHAAIPSRFKSQPNNAD